LKQEAQDRTELRTPMGRSYEPVVRHTAERIMSMCMTHRCEWGEYTYSLAKRPCERDTKPLDSTEGRILWSAERLQCARKGCIFQVHVAQILVTVQLRRLKPAYPVYRH